MYDGDGLTRNNRNILIANPAKVTGLVLTNLFVSSI